MKKTLYFFAAMTLAASTAMASKARLSALGNSQVAVDSDIQGIFQNPAYMHYVGDFATFEMGETPANPVAASDNAKLGAVVPNAEGGFINTMGDAKFGAYLGRMSTDTNSYRGLASIAVANGLAGLTPKNGFLEQENPIELFYGAKAGDLNWGASFTFSSSDKKNDTAATDDQKQTAMGMRMGVRTDDWAAYANIGLGSQATLGDAKYTGKSGATIGGHYMMDTMRVYGIYDMSGAKATNAAASDIFDADYNALTVGFTNAWKNEGNTAFYGIAYKAVNSTYKKVGAAVTAVTGIADDTKQADSALPVTLGAEVAATSWMKLRGSVTQNMLVGSTKTTVAGVAGKADTVGHDTTTAAGAGFTWGHNNLDLVMKMGTSAGLDSTDFGTNASYTYMF